MRYMKGRRVGEKHRKHRVQDGGTDVDVATRKEKAGLWMEAKRVVVATNFAALKQRGHCASTLLVVVLFFFQSL